MYPKYFIKNCDHTICSALSILFLHDPAHMAWLFEKFIFELEAPYSFKITCILVRQVITLQKNDGVIGKIYFIKFMASYLYSFNSCISINENGKYLSHKHIKQYESGHPSWTLHMKVKRSDRRPFILVLDWILVYTTSVMWMNLSP